MKVTPKEQAHADFLEEQWMMQYFELKKFKEGYGHCDVPNKGRAKNYRYHTLARWCDTQRMKRKHNPLKYSPDRLNKLNELGFSWSMKDKWFESKFQQLKQYYEKYGHCDVPLTHKNKQYRVLAIWCLAQRRERKFNVLKYSPDHEKKLNELGFSWSVSDALFERNFRMLKQYHQKYGHCNVPDEERGKNCQYRKLAQWCVYQRMRRKYSPLKYSPYRLNKLNELGFSWNVLDTLFERSFSLLKQYHKKYGHCDVPFVRKNKKNRTLGTWCNTQRNQKKLNPMKYSPDREKKLNELGFSWSVLDALFERNFNLLKQYHQKYGHCNVPDSDKNIHFRALARWCNGQRIKRKSDPLKYPPDSLKQLNELGFSWNVQDEKFEHNFQLLKQYHQKYGHCNVSDKDRNEEYSKLGRWCVFQRRLKKRNPGRYPTDRMEKLNELGFSWDVRQEWFEHRFQQLKQYHKKHGHCNVSAAKDAALASWCIKLRIAHRRNPEALNSEWIRRLTELGFIWHSIKEKENKLQWEGRFARLKEYKKKYGHCNISHSGKNKPYLPLASWVSTQREYYHTKSHRLTAERIEKLNSIGFSWINLVKPGDTQRISDHDLLTELKRLHTLCGKPPNKGVIDKHGKYSYETYFNHFGSIVTAYKTAGIDSSNHLKKHSDAELLDDLKRLAELLGKKPSGPDVTKHGKYSVDAYYSHFGSFVEARKKAGLEAQ